MTVEAEDKNDVEENVFYTRWQQVHRYLSNGLDFMADKSVIVKITELQHIPFYYKIKVKNTFFFKLVDIGVQGDL